MTIVNGMEVSMFPLLRQCEKRVFTLIATMVVLLGGLLGTATSATQDELTRGVLDAVARYELPANDALSPVIQGIGFQPRSAALWKLFPGIRKLDQVWRAAEAVAPGEGDRAIAAIANQLSVRFDSLRNNTEVSGFIKNNDVSRPVTFDLVKPSSITYLPQGTRRIITALSVYVERGGLGGIYSILTTRFDISSDKAYAIMASSDTVGEALKRGIDEVPEEQRPEKLVALLKDAQKKYAAFASDAAFVNFKGDLGDEVGDCFCGATFLGTMTTWECRAGTPC
ncbi:hypothetical protein [Mesorhizobium sp. B1-1-8]|uniref:hypothetical protein n=1 Tax=Mesorhizobium sp. B1-1-8 TaxID=2589976 RepID=UPI001126808E|nr:hypothetical protein [Mesorhizobium sp. B1-1-8]UCI07380.1 hypothetical protein FJ974_26955 [Mesorhizobium sp. B1-1-8]